MRLDQLLLQKGLVESRTQAQKMIASGLVSVHRLGHWKVASKASEKYEEDIDIRVKRGAEQRFVSRAGLKLDGALQQHNIDVKGLLALDIGQSTGGFTDCLLQRGAEKVVGIDVGRDQLSARIKDDPRVVCLEGVNARDLPGELMLESMGDGAYPGIIVMDVSFISQTLILPGLKPYIGPQTYLVSLVKPQFEVGPEGVGKGGIVKDSALYRSVEDKICNAVTSLGLSVRAYDESVIQGGDGNREFLIVASR